MADVKLSILYHLTQGTGIEANNGLCLPLLVSQTILIVTSDQQLAVKDQQLAEKDQHLRQQLAMKDQQIQKLYEDIES